MRPHANTLRDIIDNQILPVIDGILDDLENFPNLDGPAWTFVLTPDETGAGANIEVDYGDILPFKAMLYSLKATLEYQSPWNFDLGIDQTALNNYLRNTGLGEPQTVAEFQALLNIFSLNTYLFGAYPNWGMLNPTAGYLNVDGPTVLAQLKADILRIIRIYSEAVEHITHENVPEGTDPQDDELIYIDPNYAYFANHWHTIINDVNGAKGEDVGDFNILVHNNDNDLDNNVVATDATVNVAEAHRDLRPNNLVSTFGNGARPGDLGDFTFNIRNNGNLPVSGTIDVDILASADQALGDETLIHPSHDYAIEDYLFTLPAEPGRSTSPAASARCAGAGPRPRPNHAGIGEADQPLPADARSGPGRRLGPADQRSSHSPCHPSATEKTPSNRIEGVRRFSRSWPFSNRNRT